MTINNSSNLFYDNNIEQLHSLINSKEIDYRNIILECIEKTKEIDPKYHVWASFNEYDLLNQIDKSNIINNEINTKNMDLNNLHKLLTDK